MVYTFFDKKSASLAYKSTEVSRVTAVTNKSVSQKQQLAKELHKPIIKKIKKRKIHASFKDNIWVLI